jgi:hypothetical protein
LRFDSVRREYAFFAKQIPHTWKEGSPIYPHAHWTPINTDGGGVVWRLEWTIATVYGSFPLTSLESITVAANAEEEFYHDVSSFTPIPMIGNKVSTMIVGNFSRVPDAAGDDYGFDAVLHELDFHIEIDSTGSDEEFTKNYPL